jgi:ketosteroid isomerase-like protein
MSEENVEIVRRSFERICAWDIEALIELYAPDVVFQPLTGTQVESGGYKGHDGVRAYFEEVGEIWDEMLPHADDVRTVDDKVVVLGGCAVRGRGSGAHSDSPMAWVITVRDGKVTSHRGFHTRDAALAEVGLEE